MTMFQITNNFESVGDIIFGNDKDHASLIGHMQGIDSQHLGDHRRHAVGQLHLHALGKVGGLAKYGLDYASLSAVNPGLVYCSITGFGQTGPDALKPAYDQIIQGLSGEMAVNGDERLNPLRAGFPVCDTVGGLNGAFAIMAALYYRERTGKGELIDIAMLASIMPLIGWVAANLLIAHQDQIEALLANLFAERDPEVIGNDYVVIGTVERKAWREGMKQPKGIDDMLAHLHDFKEVLTVEYQPAGWYPADEPD